MPASARTANFGETCAFEYGNKAHESITGRIRIDRICFYNRSAFQPGVIDGSRNDTLSDTPSPQSPDYEKTGKRPDPFIGKAVIDKATVRGTGGNGTPGNGLVIDIAEYSDGYAFIDTLCHGCFSASAIPVPGFLSRSAPNHTPTRLRCAAALKQAFKVGPSTLVDGMKDETFKIKGFSHLFGSSP